MRSRLIILCSVTELHSAVNAFSACSLSFNAAGRRARMSYAAARAGRRWFWEGSEKVRVRRRRIVVLGGMVMPRSEGSGIGLLIWEEI